MQISNKYLVGTLPHMSCFYRIKSILGGVKNNYVEHIALNMILNFFANKRVEIL
jgi:hypothetical protein